MDRARCLDLANIFLMLRMGGKLSAVDLILGHCSDIDRRKRFAGSTGKLGGCVVTGDAGTALRDGRVFRFGIGTPVGKPVERRSCTSGTVCT